MSADVPKETLVVVSKLKKYVKASSGLRTSESVLPVLSDLIRAACDRAVRRAQEDGRQTVMDRDFPSEL